MPNYHFRVRFQLPHNRVLDSEEQSLDLHSPTGRGTCVIAAVSGESFRESQWLLIKDGGEGFSTEDEAAQAGRHVKNAVMWWGAKERVGIDVGNDATDAIVTQTCIDRYREEQGIRLLNELHGLQVYEEDPKLPTKFVWSSVEAKLRKGVEVFEQSFHEAFDLGLEFTERETLAFELYGLSHFESAERARFLTLINAIESISESEARSSEAVRHVEKLIELTRDSGLSKSEIDSLIGSLGWLRQESISKSGRDLVDRVLDGKKYGGKVAKDFFQHCYGIRSDIVHRGKPSDEKINLRTLVDQLDQLVADLLLAGPGRSDA
ncbi:MAG: hypothetical protein H0U04_15735 [Rubrobacter sp.]|nr:hypothetical protein [Rubrobacter sp.]